MGWKVKLIKNMKSVPLDKFHKPGWYVDKKGEDKVVFVFDGDWIVHQGRVPIFQSKQIDIQKDAIVRFDVSRLRHWDSSLIGFLWDIKQFCHQNAVSVDVSSLPKSIQKLLDLLPYEFSNSAIGATPQIHNLFSLIGGWVIDALVAIGSITEIFFIATHRLLTIVHGRIFMRRKDLLANIIDAGPSALVIISVVSFLMGSILAFVGAVQLKKFAADSYVANLVATAMVREMAAVITAIVMAGRTGGSYAARIAAMQGNEEIDALTVFGIPVMDYIILPSILALMITIPILYLYSCLVGMVGGFAVAILMLDVTALGYWNQSFASASIALFVFGFWKSLVFAAFVGVTSCYIGLQVGRSAADVGRAATRAVVVGIVGIIALDSLFAVLAEAGGF